MHAWSAATPAGGVTADVVIIPTAKEIVDSAGFARWLAGAKGKLVLIGQPQLTCRPDSDIHAWADSTVYHHAVSERDSAAKEWGARRRFPMWRTPSTTRHASRRCTDPQCSTLRQRRRLIG